MPTQTTAVSRDGDDERREFRQTFKWVTGVHLFASFSSLSRDSCRCGKKPEQVTLAARRRGGRWRNASVTEVPRQIPKSNPRSPGKRLKPRRHCRTRPWAHLRSRASSCFLRRHPPRSRQAGEPNQPHRRHRQTGNAKTGDPQASRKATPKRRHRQSHLRWLRNPRRPRAQRRARQNGDLRQGFSRTGTAGPAVTGSGKGTGKVGSGQGAAQHRILARTSRCFATVTTRSGINQLPWIERPAI